MLGLMTGKSNGVSTVAVLVFSLPILPSKSFSLISKLKVKPKQETPHTYKKHLPQISTITKALVCLHLEQGLFCPNNHLAGCDSNG